MTSSPKGIKSRKHAASPYIAALAALAVAAPAIAVAQDHPEHRDGHHGDRKHGDERRGDRHHDDDQDRKEVVVTGQREGYNVKAVSSAKKTQPLLDTPQTLTVISKDLLDDQNAASLADALRNTPGITMQLGENGNTSTGDTFQMRGFASQTSLYLDGVRDMGAVTRDIFNVEQVEIAKGPAGADTGRGASSGYINLVSKLPHLANDTTGNLSAYSQGGLRATLDTNIRTGDATALRLNLMAQDVDVAGRSFVKNSSFGIAPAFATGLGRDTTFYVFGQYVKQDNVPDGGIPTIGEDGYYNASAPVMAGEKVDRENYYGHVDDFEKTEAAMLTSKIVHRFDGGMVLTNTSRYGSTTQERVLTGINTIVAVTPADPSTWTVSRSRQRTAQDNTILFNQTNLNLTAKWGGLEHDIATGVEVGYESQHNDTFALPANVTAPPNNLYNPDPYQAVPTPVANGAFSEGSTLTVAAYILDTIIINDQWRVNGSARLDNYSIDSDSVSVSTATSHPSLPVGTLVPSAIDDSGTLLSWNLGVLYKPTEASSLYAAYGNALTPPGGNNFQLNAAASNIANPNFDPQEVGSFEAGAKWEVFDRKLSLNASWYHTVAKNELTQADPLNPGVYLQVGERKVSGFEFSAIGQINPKWMISAGVQTMDTEIEQGNSATGNNSAGAATRWSPELTGTIWTTYVVSNKLTLGIGGSYVGEQLRVVDPAANPAASSMPEIPAYFVANAMANYDLTDRVSLQLNVYNLFDERYMTTLNNGGSRYVSGAPLSAALTARVKF